MRISALDKLINRRQFDPAKRADLKELKFFIDNQKWKNGCPFYLEEPWEEIPVMCLQKYAAHSLKKMK